MIRGKGGAPLTVHAAGPVAFPTVGGRGPLVDPATPYGAQPFGLSGFELTFSDEFEAGTLNTGKWEPHYPDTPFWNATVPGGHLSNTNEPQAYDPSGITFDGSDMVLTMRNQSTILGLPYTSGMVSSYPAFSQTYGYFEARMKLNPLDGMWPAFWMDPADQAWPPEIDIMESWGGYGNQVQSNYIPSTGVNLKSVYDVYSRWEWNTFGVHWAPGVLRFYINGYNHFTVTDARVPAKPMYLICNLAGDKDRIPAPDILPQSIRVDYIRAWQ